MNEFDRNPIRVVACDIFGTATDWYTGIVQQSAAIFRELGLTVDTAAFANEWRDQYRPSLQRVRDGTRAWAYLDTLHRESLDELLARHGVADAVDEHSRRRLVHAWHRLPAWPDAANGLARIRDHYTTAALSNGGFALVTTLVKTAELPFDCVLSAELAKTYKPDRRVYRTATELLDVSPAEVLLVAAHNWDIDGAADAGLRTAFLERPQEKGPQRTADRASDTASDLTATSFGNLADALGC